MGLLGLVTTGAGHAWDPVRHCSAVMATPPMVRATPTSGLPVGTEDSACSSLSPSMLEAPTSAVATVMTRTPSHWLGLGLQLGLGLELGLGLG